MGVVNKRKSVVNRYSSPEIVNQLDPYAVQIEPNIKSQYLHIFSSDNGAFVGFIHRDNFENARHGDNYVQLVLTKIIDTITSRVFLFDEDANYYDSRGIMDEDYELVDVVDPLLFTTDIFGNLLPFGNAKEVSEEKKSVKVFSGKIKMNFGKVMLAINNHREFWNLDSVTLVDSETVIEKLIKIATLQPDQFDELFTIETDKPESPLMRRFMEQLSILVNEQLGDNVEGIENMLELQTKAYEFAGYQGKSLETVISESKDYFRYFRYLLTRGEKIVVTEAQKEYFDLLSKLCSKNSITRKKTIDYEICEMTQYSNLCFYSEKIPNFHITKNKIESEYFAFVENIRNTDGELDNSDIAIKIALIDELLTKEFLEKIKGGLEKATWIFVCDKNLNYARFLVRGSTISKWKKHLEKRISLADLIIGNGKTRTALAIPNDCVL